MGRMGWMGCNGMGCIDRMGWDGWMECDNWLDGMGWDTLMEWNGIGWVDGTG